MKRDFENIKLFSALSNQTRYDIIKCLLSGELCACQIPPLIKKTQSNTSMHLSKLNDLGIVSYRRDGKKLIYSIKDKRVIILLKNL